MKLGEKLIQGDLPIIEYRRKRAELQRIAAQQGEFGRFPPFTANK